MFLKKKSILKGLLTDVRYVNSIVYATFLSLIEKAFKFVELFWF